MVRPSAGTDLVLRAARLEDCRRIAELFEISSDRRLRVEPVAG
jgi:hypothetical protein